MSKSNKLDAKKYRDNPAAIAQYLTEVFEKNDLGVAVHGIRSVMGAQNVQALSEITGMRRDALYRTFKGKANPLFGRILTLFAGLDVRIVVHPLPPKERPPRPKLGRPPSGKQKISAQKAKRQAAHKRSQKAIARANK
jgi:probable addiction module antidote protein